MRFAQFSLYSFVVAFWLSSWILVPPDAVAIIATVGFVATFIVAVRIAAGPLAQRQRADRVLSRTAVVLLAFGAIFATLAGAVGTSVDGALALFSMVGIAAFVRMLSELARHADTAKLHLGAGGTALLVLAAWSWISAFSMYIHRGAAAVTSAGCVLVPRELSDYDTQLTSIWHMRVADVASSRTGPTGTTILDYHAILVSPGNAPDLYNWSKVWLRFEPLSRVRNPGLPSRCPRQLQ